MPNLELKYVRHNTLGFVLWPRSDVLWHAHVGRLLLGRAQGLLESAGFASVAGGVARCWGRSDSLNLGSRPDDSQALAAQLGLREPPASIVVHGPQGCGKTRNAPALARALGLYHWRELDAMPRAEFDRIPRCDHLLLTNKVPPELAGLQAIPFDQAIQLVSATEAQEA